MTPREAAAIVTLLVQAPSRSGAAWSIETQELFGRTIEDLPKDATEAAVMTWIRTQSERPTIADIRNAVRAQLATAGAIPGELEPDEAWGYVVQCFLSVGSYHAFPRSPHPLVAEVVERMGWQTLCASDNAPADRAHFLRVYAAALDRQRTERLARPALQLPSDTLVPPERQLAPPTPRPDTVKALASVREILAQLPQPSIAAIGQLRKDLGDEPKVIRDKAALAARKQQREKLHKQAATLNSAIERHAKPRAEFHRTD